MKAHWSWSDRPKHGAQEALRSSWSCISKKKGKVVVINLYGCLLWHWVHLSSGLHFGCANLLGMILCRSISFQNIVYLHCHAPPVWIFLQWSKSVNFIGYWGNTGWISRAYFLTAICLLGSQWKLFFYFVLWELLAVPFILPAFQCFTVCFSVSCISSKKS